jgi:glycosyltransferase involved in cell wall biosynthesis
VEKVVEKSLKILLVSHYFLPRHVAGTEVYTYRLGKTLSQRGHEVRILAGEDNPNFSEPRTWEENVSGLPVTFMTSGKMSRWGHFKQSWKDGQRPYLEPLFKKLLDQFQPDIVHIQHLATLSANFIRIAKQRGIPVVVMLNDYWFLCQRIQLITSDGYRCQGFKANRCAQCLLIPYPFPVNLMSKSFVRKASEKRFEVLGKALREADEILSPSQYLKQVYENHGFEKKIIHCDYGFPLPDKIEPLTTGIPLKVGYMGSLVPHKGIHVLIDAINQLEGKAHLMVYGATDSNPKYFKYLKSINLEYVTFAGVSDPLNPYPTISTQDVIVVPSLWDENSPLVIHEAQAVGRPVVASKVGGIPEVIRDGVDGILVPPDDVTALADILNNLVVHPERLVEIGKQCRQPKSIEYHAKKIEDMYLRILPSSKIS